MKNDRVLFESRPLRLAKCPRCAGHGSIVEHYGLAWTDGNINGAPEDAVRAVGVGAVDIFTACREAVSLAQTAKRPVAFDFNGKLVVVRADDDPKQVARDWWQRMHGETPEASAARR